MTTTTEFDCWLDMADPDDHEEVYALHQAVSNIEESGIYSCSSNNGRYFIKADHVEDTLMLASDKARNAFLSILESRYGAEEFGGIEGWYGYKRAIAKDD